MNDPTEEVNEHLTDEVDELDPETDSTDKYGEEHINQFGHTQKDELLINGYCKENSIDNKDIMIVLMDFLNQKLFVNDKQLSE